jgi:hypothetical protein
LGKEFSTCFKQPVTAFCILGQSWQATTLASSKRLAVAFLDCSHGTLESLVPSLC